jgi:hypothetical protein
MTSGRTRLRHRRWLATLLCATACASAADERAALDTLFVALARPVPTSTVFVEQRSSALLDAPIELRGSLQRPEAGTLVRVVEAPADERSAVRRDPATVERSEVERTTVRGNRVTVERAGKRSRSFAASRSPELVALLASFQALLDGDHAALDPHYTLALTQDDARWTLQLTPRQPRLQQRLGTIALHGRDAELECIVTTQPDGAVSRTLLGAPALQDVPAFDTHCG